MPHTIPRLPAVKSATGLSRSTRHLRIANGVFTHPVSLGGRGVGWPAHKVAALNAARIAGKPDTEIRELVTEIEAAAGQRDRGGTTDPMRKHRPSYSL